MPRDPLGIMRHPYPRGTRPKSSREQNENFPEPSGELVRDSRASYDLDTGALNVKDTTRRVAAEDVTADVVEEAAAGIAGSAGILADFIYGWVEAVLKGSPDVDDATQEAFLAVLYAVRNGDFQREVGKPSSWVVKISVNKAIDFHRRHQRHLHRFDSEEPVDELLSSGQRDLGQMVDGKSAISSLSEEEKAILLLRYYEGFSIEEISEILSIPTGTVKSRTFRAYTKLRDMVCDNDSPAHVNSPMRGEA